MSKDLLKRAEDVAEVFAEWLDMDSMTKESAATVGLLIQELHDKLKGDAERLESKEFLDYMELSFYSAMCTWYGNARDFEEGLCKELAQHAINVIKGDGNDN